MQSIHMVSRVSLSTHSHRPGDSPRLPEQEPKRGGVSPSLRNLLRFGAGVVMFAHLPAASPTRPRSPSPQEDLLRPHAGGRR